MYQQTKVTFEQTAGFFLNHLDHVVLSNQHLMHDVIDLAPSSFVQNAVYRDEEARCLGR